MCEPWFLIRCPTCHQFWGERGRRPPEKQIVTPCLLCHRRVVIIFGSTSSSLLTVTHVSDAETGRPGDWSPLLDSRVHWKEVN
jgi:hypothetical protein